MAAWLMLLPCRCGHRQAVHRHYRAGTGCPLCPCARFRPRLLRMTATS